LEKGQTQLIRCIQIGLGWFPQQFGGLNKFFYDLWANLPMVDVSAIGMLAGDGKFQADAVKGIHFFASSSDSGLTRYFNSKRVLKRLVGDGPLDCFVSHFCLYTYPNMSLIKKSGKPLVVHFHGPWSQEGEVEGNQVHHSYLKKWIEKSVYTHASKLITLSTAFRDILVKDYRISEDNVHVIPGGVDIGHFYPNLSRKEARDTLNWPKDRPLLFVVRRHVQRMGLENLIDSVAQLKRRFPDILLMIGGKGPLSELLNRKIGELGLQENIRMLGFIPDEILPVAYRASDLSIVPSIALEGFGLIVAESLASGTPCMVTPVGGMPEILREFSPDLILNGNGVENITDGLSGWLSGKLKLPSREECVSYAQSKYNWQTVTGQIREVYDLAISGK